MNNIRKARMFNRKASKKKSKSEQIIKALNIQPGQSIADIGSGGGFFSFLFSTLVGDNGTIYTIDTNKDFLDYIKRQAHEKALQNIQTILATDQHIPLPKQSVDLVFVRNVYHHLQNRITYFTHLKELLRPQARVAIIEYAPYGSPLSFHRRCGHNVPQQTIVAEMKQAGYRVVICFDFLKTQSFTIFGQGDK